MHFHIGVATATTGEGEEEADEPVAAELQPHLGGNLAPHPADDEAGVLRLAPPPRRLRVPPLRPRVRSSLPHSVPLGASFAWRW
jgi:hypothetical protein